MFTSQPTNQRTISRFKLYPYGWLSPIPFEKNKTDGAAFDNVHFWRTACHHMPPKVRATARANMPMCPSKLSFLFKLLMDTETHLSVSCCDFFFKFHGKKKTWRNLKLVTRWISNIYYNIIIWIWKDISSNVGLLQVGSNPTFVPPGSPRFFCSHLLEPLSTEPLPLFLGSFLKQSRAVHMFSQIDAMFALVQRFETLCVSKKTKKMPHVSYWMCFFLGCIPQFQTRPKDMYIPVTSHNMHAMVWLVQSLRKKKKKNISLCCRYVACFATFYTYRQYE